jgi:hypothetical protein
MTQKLRKLIADKDYEAVFIDGLSLGQFGISCKDLNKMAEKLDTLWIALQKNSSPFLKGLTGKNKLAISYYSCNI